LLTDKGDWLVMWRLSAGLFVVWCSKVRAFDSVVKLVTATFRVDLHVRTFRQRMFFPLM
jgi:hypothetical protein